MVVAGQKRLHQVARSTGDMLATLRQATSKDKRAICKEEKGRLAASSNFVSVDLEYNKFSDVSNEENEDESLVSKQNAEHHQRAGQGEQEEEEEEEEEETLRRVPLLENGHNRRENQLPPFADNCITDNHGDSRQKSRWKSCRWLGDEHELDYNYKEDNEQGANRMGRSVSKKSLMESLFSHSGSVNHSKNCDLSTTTRRNKTSNSNIRRDKFHRHQHQHPQHNYNHNGSHHQYEDELFLAGKDDEVDGGDGAVHQGARCNNSNKEKLKQCFGDAINNLQQSEKEFSSSSSANKHSLKLLSLLSHDDDDKHDHDHDHGEHSLEFKGPSFGEHQDNKDQQRSRIGEQQLQSRSHFNDGEASLVAQGAIMASCEFPARTIGDCHRSTEQQHHQQQEHHHHELRKRNKHQHQQQQNQLKKQQLAATARKLASSSPILTPKPNDNYDATGDCFGRSNKEFCDATSPATCNKKHSSTALLPGGGDGGDGALELSLKEKRQHHRQKIASVAIVATRNGQVTLTKLPRAERARTQKQLEAVASLKNQRLKSKQQQRAHACQRDLSDGRPWSSLSSLSTSSSARLANNGQRQPGLLSGLASDGGHPLEPIGHRRLSTDRSSLSARPSQDLVVVVAAPVSASSSAERRYYQAGYRHDDEAQQKKLLPLLASVGSAHGKLNSLVETSVASSAGLGGHEKHYEHYAGEEAEGNGNDSRLAAQRHNAGKLTTGTGAKNNAHELSPGLAFVGLASNTTTTTTKPSRGASEEEEDDDGGQREAANHPGQRLFPATNADQLLLLASQKGQQLQQHGQQQPPARRTVTSGSAPLACQLDKGNEHQVDEENNGQGRLSCLVSMDDASQENGGQRRHQRPRLRQRSGASQNDIRWRGVSVGGGASSQYDEDDYSERRHDSVHQSETTNGRRRRQRERDDEQIGSEREGFSVEIEVPEQMSSDRRDQRAGWQGQNREQRQEQQMHTEIHDLDNGKSVTTRLVDTCASSWRQAALMASPVLSNLAGGSHSGSYKVAQRQRRHQHQVTTTATSSNHSSQQTNQKPDGNIPTGGNQYGTSSSSKGQDFVEKLACYSLEQVDQQQQQQQQQQQREQYQQQEQQQGTNATNTTTTTTTTCKQHDRNSRSASQRRLSRPGRSPISLQRQTNARLARHRLKIQQQRQEQLASLALREREQFSSERQQLVLLYNRQGQLQRQSANPITVSGPRAGASSSTTIGQTMTNSNNELEIEILPPLGQQREARGYQPRANQSGKGNLLRDLFERLSGIRRSSSSNNELQHQQQVPNSSSGPRAAAAVALVDFSQQSSRVLGPRIGQRLSQQQQQQQQGPSRQGVAIQLCDSNYLDNSRGRHQASNSASQREQRIVSTNMQQLSSGNHNNTRAQRQTQSQMSSKRSSADSAFESTTTTKTTAPSLSSSSSASSSASSSTLSLNKPFCKICHLSSTRNGSDKLISPCKCSGTMQYIHCGCLLKWLEISNRTNEKPISCELCSHEYTWHKRFNYRHMKLPKCSTKDILLHMIFVLALGGMLFCALAPLFNRSVRSSSASASMTMSDFNSMSMEQAAQQVIIPRSREISFGSDHHINRPPQQQQQDRLAGSSIGSNIRPTSLRSHSNDLSTSALPSPSSSSSVGSGRLANDEKFILICAAFFFISFFIAIYAQTNTRDTLYGLIVKFTNMNLTYYITEYDHGITITTNTETTTTPTTTTTSATRDINNEFSGDHSRMNATHNYSNSNNNNNNNNNHQHQASEQIINTSQQQQHSNGATESSHKGRVVNKHLYGQSHLLNNGRKASV